MDESGLSEKPPLYKLLNYFTLPPMTMHYLSPAFVKFVKNLKEMQEESKNTEDSNFLSKVYFEDFLIITMEKTTELDLILRTLTKMKGNITLRVVEKLNYYDFCVLSTIHQSPPLNIKDDSHLQLPLKKITTKYGVSPFKTENLDLLNEDVDFTQ